LTDRHRDVTFLCTSIGLTNDPLPFQGVIAPPLPSSLFFSWPSPPCIPLPNPPPTYKNFFSWGHPFKGSPAPLFSQRPLTSHARLLLHFAALRQLSRISCPSIPFSDREFIQMFAHFHPPGNYLPPCPFLVVCGVITFFSQSELPFY